MPASSRFGGSVQAPLVDDYEAFRNSYDHRPARRLAPPGGALTQPIGRAAAALRSLARTDDRALGAAGQGTRGAAGDAPYEVPQRHEGPRRTTYYSEYEPQGDDTSHYDEDLPMAIVRDRRQRLTMPHARLVNVLMVAAARRDGARAGRVSWRGLYMGERW